MDRKQWVSTKDLLIGETLKTLDGTMVVESRSKREEPETVYNIEVEGDHVYRVGESGVLVHNASIIGHLHPITGSGDACYHYAETAAAKRLKSTDKKASACLKNYAALKYRLRGKKQAEPLKWFKGSAGPENHAKDKLKNCEIEILEVFTERSPCPRQCASIVGDWLDSLLCGIL